MSDSQKHILYHYTSTAGALGILRSGSLWATDMNYLNDSQEIHYGLALALEEARQYEDRVFSAFLAHGGAATHDALLDPSWAVTCFCEEGDLLGQWRGYGGGGYSLGFDFSPFASQDVLPGFAKSVLLQVKYQPDEQQRMLAWALSEMRETFPAAIAPLMGDAIRNDAHDDGRVEQLAKSMYEYSRTLSSTRFNVALASCKDPAFAEEREWRLVTMVRHRDLQFREDKYGLVPYGVIECGFGPTALPLREIIVRPGEEMPRRVAAIRLALRRYGIPDGQVDVRESEVPFRS